MLEKKLEILEQICDLLDATPSNEVRLSFLDLSYNQLVFLKNAIEKQIKHENHAAIHDQTGELGC